MVCCAGSRPRLGLTARSSVHARLEARPLVEFCARAVALTKRLLRARFDDGIGLPAATPEVALGGRIVTLIATIWIALVVFWEIGAPFGAGHFAAATAVTTGGENMLRFGILGAVPRHLAEAPSPNDYYCHHPWGTFWTAALFVGVLGHHDFVCRLPAALMSIAMPLLLYGAGRALWGPLAGALAAAAYVVTPITLAYANFFALEVPTMFAMALTTFAWVRFSQTNRKRFAVLVALGMVLAASFDWTGFVFDALVLGTLFVRGFVVRRFVPPFDFVRFATLWATSVVLVAVLAAFFVYAFSDLGQLDQLFAQGQARATGSSLPLSEVLESRKYWILLAFTPIAIVLGKLAAPIFVVRAALLRSESELFPLAVLVTATAQYVLFKQGADIHFFWPQYFALYFAYALGALTASATELGRIALERVGRERFRSSLVWGVFASGLAVAGLMAPDAVRALSWARKSGGRFNEKGLIIHPDLDKAAVFEELAKTLPDNASLAVDASMKPSYWMDFTLRREVTVTAAPHGRGQRSSTHFALDSRFSASATLRSLQRTHAVVAYGPYWVADTRRSVEPITSFAIVSREPTLLERLFVSSSHALHSIAPDPLGTWELREHFDVSPNEQPALDPKSPRELRIAHNVAVRSGDVALAARRKSELVRGFDQRPARDFSAGVRLLGVRLERGASDFLTLYFEASGPLPGDVGFVVTSHVERAPSWSNVPADELPWNVGMPFAIPTSLWRPGFVYESVTELMRRPGRERYEGSFRGPGAPEPVGGSRETKIVVLE
jgi:hypothetical protein